MIRLATLLALSYLVDDRDKEVLKSGEDLIRKFIFIIKKAQKSRDRKFNGSIWEMLSSLKMMSVNDDMKNVIVKAGGIELTSHILRLNELNEEVEFSLCLLINLCFDKNIFENFKKKYDINKIMTRYKNHGNENITQLQDIFMWNEDNQQNEVELGANKPKLKFDVFIRKIKKDVEMIHTKLKESKLNIWIDLKEMHGFTVEAVTDGIESSAVFVMCKSSIYCTSTVCRAEAEYAFKLKKPIIPIIFDTEYAHYGRVGIIIGSKKYLTFNSRLKFKLIEERVES